MFKCPSRLVYVGTALKIHVSELYSIMLFLNIMHNYDSAASLNFWRIEDISPSPTVRWLNSLLLREAYWIHPLNTVEPFGLNEELNLSNLLHFINAVLGLG